MYSPSDPRTVRSGVDGAILSRKEKSTRLGQSSRGPNPAPPRLFKRGNRAELFPVSQASGPIHFRLERVAERSPKAHAQLRGNTFKSVGWLGFVFPFLFQQAEPALPRGGAPSVLTLAAEPEVVRGYGRHCPVVALHFLPLSLHAPGGGQSGGARIFRRPAVVSRARLRPASPASSVSRRPAPR